jgi:hypothetical protein
MVNLLFISNSTKIDAIKVALQPFLKVKIDVVADFDFGLKDVFEKRPATVFIQDQIAGVTGESVARHIQMLLGSGSPSFIFMHEGSSKARPVKGLFEHLVDLSQSDIKVVEDIQATLKSLLGPQWDKIYIPPKVDKAAIRDALAVPEENRAIADQLVNDFLSDLEKQGVAANENKNQIAEFAESVKPADDPFDIVSSPQEQLAEMLSESGRVPAETAVASLVSENITTQRPSLFVDVSAPTQLKQQTKAPKHAEEVASPVAAPVAAQQQSALKVPAQVVSAPLKKSNSEASSFDSHPQPEAPPLEQTSPADFIIVGERPSVDVAAEDLLRVFEGDFSTHTNNWKRSATIVIVLLICAGGGVWYLQKNKPHFLTVTSKPSAAPVIATSKAQPLQPVTTNQKPDSAPVQKVAEPALPSFIPQAGLDRSFAVQKPGWERYVTPEVEYRVYRPAGKIKALQVLGVKNREISGARLKSILIELVGDGEFHIKSSEQKLGYHITRASIGQNSDLLIYRKKTTVRAFVVSLD